MIRYSFPKLLVLACASLILLLAGCDQQSAMKEPTEETSSEAVPTEREKRLNAALDAMARDVAAALENQSVRTLIKKETGKLLAGQHNVLYKDLASRKVNGQTKRQGTTTFEQVLAQQRTGSAKFEREMDAALDGVRADAATIPKFDIGVPVHHESWDPKEAAPLVAFHHRQEIDDTELERVKAYDAEGTVRWLDAEEAPDRPVVVVGVNERTTAGGKVIYGNDDSGKYKQICLQSAAKCGGGGGGGGGGSGEDRREYGDNEYLDRARVLDDHENWVLEDPEVMIEVRGQTQTGLQNYGLKNFDLNWDGGGMFSDDTSWRGYDVFFFKWTQDDAGGYTIWNAYEYDEGESVEFTITYQGQEYGFDWTNDNDDMGYQAVQFENDDDIVYDLGDIKFETESKNP